MAAFVRAPSRRSGVVPGFATNADMLEAIMALHLKPSEIAALFRVSRGVADRLMARPDFPLPFDVSGDGKNLRYAVAEVIAYRDANRREIRTLGAPRGRRAPIAAAPSAEAAVRRGLAALRADKKPTDYR